MNVDTTKSYEQSSLRLQKIAAIAPTNNDLSLTYQQKNQSEPDGFAQESNQQDRLNANQKVLSKLQEEELKSLYRILSKNDKFLKNGNTIDMWY